MKYVVLGVALALAAGWGTGGWAEEPTPTETALGLRVKSMEEQEGARWYIQPYRPTYVMPISYIDEPSLGTDPGVESAEDAGELQHVEVKFQISLRLEVAEDLVGGNGDLNFAYTQVSVWQAFNSDNSSPFRDTNYEPEMFMSFDTDYELFGLHGRMVHLGLVHQSNGRGSAALSRSWNRVYVNALLERGNFACSIKPWWRLPEDDEEDNNPHIEDYLGYGEFRAAYRINDHTLSTLLRNNLEVDENRGAVELDWSFPLGRSFKGFIQYFYGYGETLLTYNEKSQRVGLGFLLADWL